YFTDPGNGDQFEQLDARKVFGADAEYSRPTTLFGHNGKLRTGLQWRRDDIGTVGLYKTRERERLATTREDDVVQDSYSLWISQDQSWTNWLRSEAGVRMDAFRFAVASNIAANSSKADDHIVSPKLSVVLGPWRNAEVFLNWGQGFHS